MGAGRTALNWQQASFRLEHTRTTLQQEHDKGSFVNNFEFPDWSNLEDWTNVAKLKTSKP
jgi:hypothetical protein